MTNGCGSTEVYELKRISTERGFISTLSIDEEGRVAYLGHRKGLTPNWYRPSSPSS